MKHVILIPALISLFSLTASAREIHCTSEAADMRSIAKVDLTSDGRDYTITVTRHHPHGSKAEGYDEAELSKPAYVSQRGSEEVFNWYESSDVDAGDKNIEASDDLDLVKKVTAEGNVWVLRVTRNFTIGLPRTSMSKSLSVIEGESTLSCTEKSDNVVDPDAERKRCEADPYHCPHL